MTEAPAADAIMGKIWIDFSDVMVLLIYIVLHVHVHVYVFAVSNLQSDVFT